MKTPILCLWMVLLLTLALWGCGTPSKTVSTRIDGPRTDLSDHFQAHDNTGASRSTKISISPPSPNALPAAIIPQNTTIIPQNPQIIPKIPPAVSPEAPIVPSAAITQAPAPVIVKLDGREIQAPAGSAVTLEVADNHVAAETVHDQSASAVGATIRTDGDASKLGVSASAPEVKIDPTTNTGPGGGGSKGGGGNASGGGFSFDFTAMVGAVATKTGANWLVGIGILWLVAAGLYVVAELLFKSLPDWGVVAVGVIIGFAFIGTGIMVEKYPWIFVLLVLTVLACIVGYVLWWKFGKKNVVAETPAVATLGTMAVAVTAPNPLQTLADDLRAQFNQLTSNNGKPAGGA